MVFRRWWLNRRPSSCLAIVTLIFGNALQADFACASILTLPEVLQSVLVHYPLMTTAKLDVEKTRADLFAKQGRFDPVLKAAFKDTLVGYYRNTFLDIGIEQPTPFWGARIFGGYRSGQGNFPLYDGRYSTFTGGEFRVGIDLPLLKNGLIDERRAQIGLAKADTVLSQAGLQASQADYEKQATHRYWEWVAAGRKVSIATDLLKIAQTRNKALHQRVQHGDASPFEQMDNQRAVVQRESNLLSSERSLLSAALELSLYLRDSDGQPILVEKERLPGSFPEIEASFPIIADFSHSADQIESLVDGNPKIRKYELKLGQIQIEYQLAKNQILPKLDFYVHSSRDTGQAPIPTLSTAFFIPNYIYEVKAGISFEMPLFLRSARGKLESTHLQIEKLQLEKDLAQDQLKNQIENALQSIHVAKSRVGLAQQEIELAKKLESGERVRFEHGDSNLFVVNLREQATVDAEIREVEAWVDFYRAQADYRAAITQFTEQTS